jgi:putative ATP-dependent endonuclease of the OLD family
MRIARITVENYRSIKNAQVAPTAFSVFVGQNNHGKTNFFEAIEWFFTAKSSSDDERFCKEPGCKISVQLDFDAVLESDIQKLSTEGARTKIQSMLDGSTSFSVRKTSVDHKRTYIVDAVDKGNPTGLDNAINEFLPKLEYVNTRIRLDDVAKYKDKNPIGAMLSGVLTAIIETSEDYKKFKTQFATLFEGESSEVRVELNKLGGAVEVYLQKQFPDDTKIKFNVNPPLFTDLLKSFETSVDDGIETRAEEKGDGMQRAIMLSIIQAFADYRRRQFGGGSFLFLIDEAELHLHPSAQRALKQALLDVCETDQVLVNTHSSVLVADNHPQQKVFRVQKEKRITSIEPVDEQGRADVIYELLGGSPADLLLPRNFLIVEGKSEFEFLSAVVRRFYSVEFQGIKILFGGGDIDEQKATLYAVDKTLRPLVVDGSPVYRSRVVVVIDRPNDRQQAKYESFKIGYPYLFDDNRVFELPSHSLEEYYPPPFAKTAEESKTLGKQQEKVAYAKNVGAEITKDQFDSQMPVLASALTRCCELAFRAE